jgi:Raf kinase inhibitor-like YbhB/YbcL family protein
LFKSAALCAACCTALTVAGFTAPAITKQKPSEKEKKLMTIQISSIAFAEGQPIPEKHTCQGKDISPPLRWTGAPANTKSFALIADDPDAPVGIWVHWVLFDLLPTTTELSEDVPKTQHLPGGAKQGLNDFRRLGYGGPCPPPGKPHRYFFKLYALGALLDLKPGATKKDVEAAMKGHVLAEGQLMGTYQRK